MVVTDKVASVYAEALVELAREGSALDEVAEELGQVSDSLAGDAVIWKFFVSPLVKHENKLSILEKSVKPQVSKLVYGFLGTLAKRRRFEYLPAIVAVYTSLVDRELGRARVKVQTSTMLEDKQSDGLKESLSRILKKEIILEVTENPDLIGGMVIRSGDILIDTSVKSGLAELKRTLLSSKTLGEEYYEN